MTTWSSRLAFLLAAIGASVGLGNIWKFPFLAGMNGGGAFVALYLFAVLLVAIPILIGEIMVGRRGRGSPPEAMGAVAVSEGRSRVWAAVGWLGMLAAYLILSYYSVIAGWTIRYAWHAGDGSFVNMDAGSAAALFDGLLADPTQMLIWHALFMALTVVIVMRGLRGGIERATKLLMPILFVALIVMAVYAMVVGDAGTALNFLFAADFSKLTAEVALVAVGQAFFSIGVAMALMMAYGSYLPREVSISRSALLIAGADTLVALIAGLAIFPLVFAHGLDPAEGPGLIFVALPLALGNMPAGSLFGTLFFALLMCAALTSTIAVLEPVVAWLEHKRGLRRTRAAISAGLVAFLLGVLTVYSFNDLAQFHLLGWLGVEKNLFELIDYLTANIMMPVGALLLAVFVGYCIRSESLHDELGVTDSVLYRSWRFALRVIAPLALAVMFVVNLS